MIMINSSGIQRDKTMDDKSMYIISKEDKPKLLIPKMKLFFEKF